MIYLIYVDFVLQFYGRRTSSSIQKWMTSENGKKKEKENEKKNNEKKQEANLNCQLQPRKKKEKCGIR